MLVQCPSHTVQEWEPIWIKEEYTFVYKELITLLTCIIFNYLNTQSLLLILFH